MSVSKSNQKLSPFTLEEPEFDQGTYYGRFRAMQKTSNPLYAFFTNSKIDALRILLADQKEREE